MSVRNAALWSMGSQYLGFAVQFIVSVVISRYFLTPSEVGLFSIALAMVMMISILQDFGLTRYIADQPELTPAIIRACSTVAVLIGMAIAALVFLSIWPVAYLYNDRGLIPVMAVLGLSYLFSPFSIVPSSLMARELNFRDLFHINVISVTAAGVVSLATAWAGWSALSLAFGTLTQAATRTLIAQWKRPTAVPWPLRVHDLKPILRFGKGSSVLIISGAIGIRSPELIVGGILNNAAVGLFSRATGLAGQLYMLVSGAIGGVFYPAFARIRDQGHDMGAPYVRVVAGYCAATIPAMVGLAVASKPLVLALYGPKWAETADLLMWIALGQIPFVMLPLHMDLPILMGRMNALIRRNILDTAASIILLFVGAYFSIEAAAASRLGYAVLWWFIYAAFLHRLIGFDWRAMFSVYAKSGLSALASVVPLLLAYRYWVPADQMSLMLLMALSGVGAGLCVLTMAVLRHPAMDEVKTLLASMVAAVRDRRARRVDGGQ